MDRYIEKVEPIINEIITLTMQHKIEWEKVGNGAFRCVDSEDDMSIEISKHNGFAGSVVSLKLYNQNKLEYEYTPGISSKYESFDKVLNQLFDEVEKMNVESVGCKFDIILKSFKNKVKQAHAK